MRKMKKINGYLVVKFNARELREYEGTALGEYGVIDAELYTGILDVDRGAMEYDNAGSMEEAVELARGLESELDAVCEKCSLERLANEADGRDLRAREKALGALYGLVDRIRDRESSVEADRVGAEARAYLRALATVQVITERERESFAAAIEDAVKARTAPAERTTFEHLHPDLKRHRETAKIYALGLALAEKCPPNDCRVYLNIFNAARELDAALDNLDADGAPALALRKALRERVGELAEMMEDNYAVEQYRKGGGAK